MMKGDEDQVCGWDRRKTQSVKRMNGNMLLLGVEGQVTIFNFTESWNVRNSKDLMGVALSRLPSSGETDLEEPSSSR